jgi:hypothetical protein
MNDDFKYYGFYGRRGDTIDINHRLGRQDPSADPQVNNKEGQENIKKQIGKNNKLNKIFNLITKIKLHKQNLKLIILSRPSLYNKKNIFNIGFNIDHIFDNNLIIKKSIEKNSSVDNLNVNNYIFKYVHMFINIINYIIDGDILIISNNINMLLLCKKYLYTKFNFIILILFDININNLKIIHKLKNKDKIKIYFFGNILNNNLINNIINFFPNTKFSNIILDYYGNDQIFLNILSIKICKELLINNGSFIQYSKIPDFKDNLIYLYYLIFKCFKYNTFESYTASIFNDNMYSLIYHTLFEYNLNNEEEHIINELLNNNKINLNNIIYDELFMNYIYIKYLTIYYNLQNNAKKIFIRTYKLIEN